METVRIHSAKIMSVSRAFVPPLPTSFSFRKATLFTPPSTAVRYASMFLSLRKAEEAALNGEGPELDTQQCLKLQWAILSVWCKRSTTRI